MTLELREIFKTLEVFGLDVPREYFFTDVAMHSQRAGPGVLFWAAPSRQYDLGTLTQLAWSKGSDVVLTYGPSACIQMNPENPQQCCVTYPFQSASLGKLAALFYPCRPTFSCAVTGTNGKTSTVWFLSQLWSAQGIPWTTMGTLGTRSSKEAELVYSGTNTADLLTLSAALHYSELAEISCVAFEATSHGLHQGRVPQDGVNVGVWTSFSQDHLDYHQTMQDYWQAKARLGSLCRDAFLVHEDVPDLPGLRSYMSPQVGLLTYGSGVAGKNWAAYDVIDVNAQGTQVNIRVDQHVWRGALPWVAGFQCENFLAALSVLYLAKGDVMAALSCAEEGRYFPPPGRLECVGRVKGASIYVDYAHTPDGLYRALATLRTLQPRRIGLVFGCGGDRDKLKRPLMGRIAQEHADWVILTSDNPRFEDPKTIIQNIQEGCPDGESVIDRAEAISMAISTLRSGDVLLVAGKGHEDVQWTAGGPVPFQDKEYIHSVLEQYPDAQV